MKSYIDFAKDSGEAEIELPEVFAMNSKGYFIEPTTILTTNPKLKSIREEIFGPVLTIFLYDDNKLDETLELCDETSPYI